MFFNIFELLDIVLMTLVIGYLFHDVFRKPVHEGEDVLDHYRKKKHGPLGIEWHDFWWAAALIAPSILLHELGHKFVALGFGLSATFHAACSTASFVGWPVDPFMCGLTVLVVFLKVIGFPFLFFIPAAVAVGGGGTELQYALVSFAGPAMNLLLWLGAAYLLKSKKYARRLSHKHRIYLFFFKKINMILFFFNMIPIRGFDGYSVITHLLNGLH